jgi:hypothetical protein
MRSGGLLFDGGFIHNGQCHSQAMDLTREQAIKLWVQKRNSG